MRRATSVTLVAVALALGSLPVAAAAGAPGQAQACLLTSGTRTESIDFEGASRTYRVATPTGVPDQAAGLPLILNFHGLGSSGAEQAVYSQLEKKGPERGFVVITPDGTAPRMFWNILPGVPKPDDVAYASALIDAARDHQCVDPSRVYAAGMSNGAGMSALLACDLTERIAAIAPVAGINLVKPCPRGAPVSVIAFHGEEDGVVKYEGGQPGVGGLNFEIVSVSDAVTGFAKRDGCRRRPVERSIGDDVSRDTYRGCDQGTDVVLHTVTNGGHTWPGARDIPRLGHVTDDVNAADLILDFFDAHPHPRPR